LLLEGKQKEGLSVKIGRLTASLLFSVTDSRAKNLFQCALVFPFKINLFWGRLKLKRASQPDGWGERFGRRRAPPGPRRL